MARIRSIPRDRAAVVLRNLYVQAEKQFGQVPNLFKTMAHRPELLLTFSNFLKELWTGGVVDAQTKALAGLRSARLEGSGYAVARHAAFARQAGVPEEKIAAVGRDDWEQTGGFDDREKAVLRLAEKLTRQPPGVTEDDLRSLRKWFGDSHLVEIGLVVGTAGLIGRFDHCFAVEPDPVNTGPH